MLLLLVEARLAGLSVQGACVPMPPAGAHPALTLRHRLLALTSCAAGVRILEVRAAYAKQDFEWVSLR